MKVNKSIESDSFHQPRGPRGARRWQQDGLVHHDAGQDWVSLGAPGPDLRLDRVPFLAKIFTIWDLVVII
eukprot:COSAG06_NODE_5374_length_3516_cov_2.014336_4_plen_69_part_01